MTDPDSLQVLFEKIDTLQKSVDRIDRDLEDAYKNSQDQQIRIGALEAVIDELRKALSAQPNKIKDRMEDALQPVQKEIKEFKEVIEKKKFVPFKIPFWKFWKR